MTKDNKNKTDAEIEELKQRIEELENKYKRALADYQNLEKRAVGERRDFVRTANKDLLLRLLPGLDALMLAAKHVSDQGLKLSIEKFLEILKNEGVEKIETAGKVFDPASMECIETIEVDPSTEKEQEGKVVEELRAGYTLYDSILRPAQVRVGNKG